MRLIITRPLAQARTWVDALQAQGCEAQALPLINVEALADTVALSATWARLGGYALVMFVSANAVEHFFASRPTHAAWPVGTRAGSTGPGTTAALLAAGVAESAIVQPAPDTTSFDSEALWARLAHEDWAGRCALIVRGEEGRDWLAQVLRERGAVVDFIAAYRRQAPRFDAAAQALLARALAEPDAHLWVFSSSEAVGHLRAWAGADWSHSAAVASHPRIAATAQAAGFARVSLVPPTVASLVQAAAGSPSIQSKP